MMINFNVNSLREKRGDLNRLINIIFMLIYYDYTMSELFGYFYCKLRVRLCEACAWIFDFYAIVSWLTCDKKVVYRFYRCTWGQCLSLFFIIIPQLLTIYFGKIEILPLDRRRWQNLVGSIENMRRCKLLLSLLLTYAIVIMWIIARVMI